MQLYIAGESYAGQHIPYIAKAIVERNKKPDIGHKWNLKNLIIGNGWIDPDRQYEAYLDFAYQKGLIQKNSDIANKLEVQHRICLKDLAVADAVDHPSCEQVLQDLLRLTVTYNTKGQQECLNMYDVRLRDTYPSCGMNWPPDLDNVTPYLRRRDVIQALHINTAKSTGWVECNGAVGSAFRAKNSKASISFLPELIKDVPITLFSGAEDLICNHIGTEALISNMQWNGGKGFEISPGNWAPRREWTVEGQSAGFWQEARNLTYVLFLNSSHMVPFDYPRRSRDMLDRVMKVDISSIGGDPIDSRLDGEPGPETTVGGTAGNTTAAQEAEKAKLDAAKWAAYQRSGEIVLVIVAIAAVAWGYFVWRERRKRRGYQGLATSGNGSAETRHARRHTGLENFRNKRTSRDLEAGDFDESELDDLHLETPTVAEHDRRYSVGEDSDDDGSGAKKEAAASGSGS